MNDMTDEQRKAARAAMSAYPNLQINMQRGMGLVKLTPQRGSSSAGSPVTVIYGSTAARQITLELQQSCADLMGQD